jgi:3-oxoacyl-[acyl-carrier-protein] synthase-3
MGIVITATALSEGSGTISSIENASLAARAAIRAAGLEPEQIDALINTGVYRDSNMVEPAMAALIQKKTGIGLEYQTGRTPSYSFDLMNGACGVLNAVQVSTALLMTGSARHVVVVSGDTHPSLDPDTALGLPFSCVGAAMLPEHTDEEAGFGELRVASSAENSAPEGFATIRGAESSGRGAITIERPPDPAATLLPYAVQAANDVLAAERLDRERTILVTSRPAPGFGKLLGQSVGIADIAAPDGPDTHVLAHRRVPPGGEHRDPGRLPACAVRRRWRGPDRRRRRIPPAGTGPRRATGMTRPLRLVALRSVPVAGWAYIAYSLLRPPRRQVMRLLLWTDVALSVGLHAAQVPFALRALAPQGRSRAHIATATFLFGATWWKTASNYQPLLEEAR